ncbi:MAG: hypothetical protein ACI8QZ_001825 [Chlamydiales bacterium]|jgi:hypothetical protein
MGAPVKVPHPVLGVSSITSQPPSLMITSCVLPLLLWTVPSTVSVPAATIAGEGHSAWHPADSIVYIELPDVPAARREWWTTSIGKVLTDPAIHTALGALTGVEKLDPTTKVVEQFRDQVSGEIYKVLDGLLDSVSTVSLSLQPTEATPAALQGGASNRDEIMAAFGMQIVLSLSSAEVAGQAIELMSKGFKEEGKEVALEELTWNGVGGVLLRVTGDGPVGEGVQVARVGKELFIVAGVATLEAAQKRFESDAPSMGASDAWTQGVSQFSDARGTTVVELYSGLARFASLWGGAKLDPVFELTEGLLGTNGAILARGGRWRICIDDGRYVSDGYQVRAGSDGVERFLERGPLGEDALAFVNPKALVASAVQFDPKALVEVIRSESADEEGDALSRLEATHGVQLGEMIQALGDSATFSMPNLPLMTAPDIQVSVALADRDKFVAGFTGLVAIIGELLGDKGTIAIKEYRDTQLATVSLTFDLGIPGLPVDPTKIFTPTMVVLQDRVLFTATQSFAKKVVRSAAKGDVQSHDYLSQVSIPEGVSEVGYADWAKMVGGLYTMGRSMAGMFAGSAEDIPFDLTKLPDAGLFLRHFKPSLRWERRVDGGMLHHGESSFGPDLMFAAGLGGAGALLGQSSPGEPFTYELK